MQGVWRQAGGGRLTCLPACRAISSLSSGEAGRGAQREALLGKYHRAALPEDANN